MKCEDAYLFVDGKTHFMEDRAVAHLLNECVLFVSDSDTLSLELTVNTNDIFVQGADSMNITLDEVESLWKLFYTNEGWGPVKWACLKSGWKPLLTIRLAMKRAGLWDESMTALEG